MRLGNLFGGSDDVKAHPWFCGVDWDAILHKKIAAPIRPLCTYRKSASEILQRVAGDTRNFETYPEVAPAVVDREGPSLEPFQHLFHSF